MIKVFLVDDEIVIREGIRASFPWDKTEYVLAGEASDGEMALPMIRDTRPDILITDIKMPFMDGIELTRIVRREMPWISVIILSGYDEFEYARQSIQLGVNEYILKPLTVNELKSALDRVKTILEKERAEREWNMRAHAQIATNQSFLRDKLLGMLYSEDVTESDARDIVMQLRGMGIDLSASHYEVIDAAFDSVKEGYEILKELAESSGATVFASASRTGGRAIVLGGSEQDTENRAYAFADSLRTVSTQRKIETVRISIGKIVDRPELIVDSLRSARHIRHVLYDQNRSAPVIVGVRDFNESDGNRSSAVIVARAKIFLSDHFMDNNLMLQDAAKAVGMSNSRFSTVFAQESGKTFTEYLTALRMNKAKELLGNTNKRSSQIAFEVGYNDAHYFSYLFKKIEGMTPGEYRAKSK